MGQLQPIRQPTTTVFFCAGRAFSITDVIDAAHFRVDLTPAWQRLLHSVEAEEDAAERELEPDVDALQQMSDDFRSERDLITAEETEQWLAQRDLTLDDFSDHFVRRYWGASLNPKAETEPIEFMAAPAELRDLLPAELVLLGAFDALATELSWRVAARAVAAGRELNPELISAERRSFLERAGVNEIALPDWLAVHGRDAAWLDEMLSLEAYYRREREALVTEDRCRAEVSSSRLQLARFDTETVELDSLDAARETMLCVRNDGLSLEEVAAQGSYPFHRDVILLEDLRESVRERFLCAVPGEVLGPLERGDGFQVCRIREKIEPTLGDEEIRRRIEQRLLQRFFNEVCSTHIRWSIPAGLIA